MTLIPHQEKLFVNPSPVSDMVFVNDRVCFQTEGNQRVVLVQGMIFAHYSLDNRCAEAYALVLLFESGYADQNDLARCFGYSTRTLRRFQKHLQSGGLNDLARAPGRPAVSSTPPPSRTTRDQSILRLKANGMSNRWIGGRLGLNEKTIRKILRRLGWKPAPPLTLPLLPNHPSPPEPGAGQDRFPKPISPPAAPTSLPHPLKHEAKPPPRLSLDPNPLDRSADRLLAALGLLDDASPLFAPTRNLPRAGVLLAIPALVASGLLSAAEKLYGSMGPSFYGLRTTLLTYVLLALLRIPRPETLKNIHPQNWAVLSAWTECRK
jgi:DNA-binding CsgD family transcriptional regulator